MTTSHLFSEESLGSNPFFKKNKIRFKSRIQHTLILVQIL